MSSHFRKSGPCYTPWPQYLERALVQLTCTTSRGGMAITVTKSVPAYLEDAACSTSCPKAAEWHSRTECTMQALCEQNQVQEWK